MNGTVAPAVARRLQADNHVVNAWDRTAVPVDALAQHEAFIDGVKPDWVFHMAMGSPDWAANMAAICHKRGIRFLFTGSVSVFDGQKSGPFARSHVPDATDDYGRYKAECERKVRDANPDAIIARLGWQIGDAAGSNNMIDFLTKQQKEKGHVEAGNGWIPSCAFLTDTADAIYTLIQKFPGGLYQLEGNPGWHFYKIVSCLNKLHGNLWRVVEKDEPHRDNRMLEDRIIMGTLDKHFT